MLNKSNYRNNVYIKGSNGTVAFPEYTKYFFIKQDPPPQVPYTSTLLTTLLFFVDRLRASARNPNPNCQQIDSTTIYVTPLVRLAQKSSLTKNKQDLIDLFEAASLLNITPLINLFSSYIADRIYPLGISSLATTLQHFFSNSKNPLRNSEYIEKHLQLKAIGISEFTINDYLGLYGQPKTHEGILDFSRENLTSLHGINSIYASEEVTELLLDHNFLRATELALLSEYLQSLGNLKKVSLRGNRPSDFPLHSLPNLKNIQLTL